MKNWRRLFAGSVSVLLFLQFTIFICFAENTYSGAAIQSKQTADKAISNMLDMLEADSPDLSITKSADLKNALSSILTGYKTMAVVSQDIPVPDVYADASDTAINAGWNAAAQAQGYEVSLNSGSSVYVEETSYKFEGLEPNSQYTVKVRAISSYGEYGLIGDMNGDGTVDSLDFQQMGVYLQDPPGALPEELLWVGDVDGDGAINSIDYYLIRMYLLKMINYFPKSSVSQWSEETAVHTLLLAPAVTAATPSGISVDVSWNSVDGASRYDIEVDGQITDNGASVTYTHENLLPGTEHTYRIRGISPEINGEWSEAKSIWTLPDIPGNINTTPSSISIDISWSEVTGAAGYDIEVYGKPVDNGNSTAYTQTGLEPNTQRTYRVRAKNSSGAGEWSNVFAASTLPRSVLNLKVKAADNSLEVSWDAQAGALAYDIEIDGAEVYELTETKYIHTGLETNSEHMYRIRTKSGAGADASYYAGEWSETVKGTVLPSVPGNFEVANVTSSAITLDWDEVTGAAGYEIEIDGRVFDNGTATAYTHSGLNSNEEHSYRVRAFNGSAAGEWTGLIIQSTLLPAPENFKAAASNGQIVLQWDMVAGAEGYQLEADGQIIEAGTGTEYIQTGLTQGSEHKYRVRAVNGNGCGGWSREVTVTALPGIPENITAVLHSTSITIGWNPVEGAAAYEIMADGKIYTGIAGTSYEHEGLTPNSMHVYMIRAISTGYAGEWSTPQMFFTLVGIPANIYAASGSTAITLSWDETDGADSYDIMADNELIDNGTDTVYIHDGLSNNSLHSYKVRAKNENGEGEWSEAVARRTGPSVPENISADTQINQIALTWDKPEGAVSYEVEADGEIIRDIFTEGCTIQGLEPNTRHEYRVRALNSDAICSEWSEVLEVNTTDELTINVEKDTGFNFVIAVPKKEGTDSYDIVVSYNPDDVEVIDLYAATQKLDLEAGQIEGADSISVEEFSAGRIVFGMDNLEKPVMTIIRFLSKTNENTGISYTVE
ncbi:dockerin type I repeat protein [Ruminiclostridium sufflavum DSM 19573]|uniref:cellulase n=1 Tax=Ruminiclostridium sufflavum DSM 19573 TaxID=1121337 RepID=A0A318Y708_9FIRM|nr:dockerin type I domain-containing protein [Ruminiclostridium sufflavum]PYG87921.1 dockerin type I repeat protein [Ruminiclostridium sufflavum DSM 19573]